MQTEMYIILILKNAMVGEIVFCLLPMQKQDEEYGIYMIYVSQFIKNLNKKEEEGIC